MTTWSAIPLFWLQGSKQVRVWIMCCLDYYLVQKTELCATSIHQLMDWQPFICRKGLLIFINLVSIVEYFVFDRVPAVCAKPGTMPQEMAGVRRCPQGSERSYTSAGTGKQRTSDQAQTCTVGWAGFFLYFIIWTKLHEYRAWIRNHQCIWIKTKNGQVNFKNVWLITIPVRGGPFLRTVFSICTGCKLGWVGGLKNLGCANYMMKNNTYT